MKQTTPPRHLGGLWNPKTLTKHIDDFLDHHADGIIEILGATASGKTDYAVFLAQEIQKKNPRKKVEIIVVDSRQIFKHCDVAVAKISKKEMRGIPHWGLDLITPEQSFSVYDFQQYAFQKIAEIFSRGHIPILSGGTMLWLDAISENYILKSRSKKSVEKGPPRWPVFKIGLHWPRAVLYDRINQRAVCMFANGLAKEAKCLFKQYRLSGSVVTSFGYAEIRDMLGGKISAEKALAINQQRNRNYAKRQLTWWRGRPDIYWINATEILKEV